MKIFAKIALLVCATGFGSSTAQQLINCAPNLPCTTSGPSGTGTGDNPVVAFGKSNANFMQLYGASSTFGYPVVNPMNSPYNARCDGVTDDTTALQRWASSVTANSRLIVPGICVFKGPLVFPQVNWVTIEGGRAGTLLYAGTATTGTIVQIGAPAPAATCNNIGWVVRNLRLMSNTVMTGGVGLYAAGACEIDFENTYIGGDLGGNTNWYNAFEVDYSNTVHIRGGDFVGSNNGHIVNNSTDIFEHQMKATHGLVGLHITGGVGGFTIDQSDVLSNGTNVLIDQSLTASVNTQLTFGNGFASDITSGGAGIGVDIKDPGNINSSIIFFQSAWLASAQSPGGQCLYVESAATGWQVIMNGGNVLNCQSDGIRVDNTSSHVIVSGTFFTANVSHSVNVTVTNGNVFLQSIVDYDSTQFVGVTAVTQPGEILASSPIGITAGTGDQITMSPGVTINAGSGITGLTVNAASSAPTVLNGANAATGSALQVNGTFTGAGTTQTASFTDANNSNGVNVRFQGNGATTPSKTFRVINGTAQWMNNGYNLADIQWTDSGYVSAGAAYLLNSYTVSGLPTCNSGTKGALVFVTDASSPTYNATLTGGSSTITMAFCNGSNWTAH